MRLSTFITLTLLALCASNFAYSENPEYASSQLTIPAVDADGKPGYFQDIVIAASDNNLWKLVEAYEAIPISKNIIEQVELIKTDSVPVQVFLKMTGTFNDGCGAVGQVSHSLNENKYNIIAYYKLNKATEPIACTQALVPFTYTIPLPVYGNKAGEYHYTLNDAFNGSFELTVDNLLQD